MKKKTRFQCETRGKDRYRYCTETRVFGELLEEILTVKKIKHQEKCIRNDML